MDTEVWGNGPPKRPKRHTLVGEEVLSSISDDDEEVENLSASG